LLSQERLATEATSNRPISLLPELSKFLEKLPLRRLKPMLGEKQIMPTHQFGFRNNHSTVDQVHRITTVIEKTLEELKVCCTISLDVAQDVIKFGRKDSFTKLSSSYQPNTANC
jgi:hypothetical protein